MSDTQRLLSGRVLAKNTVWTLLGFLVPALAGLVAIPFLVRGFGDERFGVLTLAWAIIGYFSVFDLGLGRGVTRHLAELLASAQRDRIARAMWTAWYLMAGLGMLGGLVATLAAPLLVEHVAIVSPALRVETVRSFELLALAIPVVVLTTGVSGVLQASQRFDLVTAVRVPSGLLTFLVPLAVLRFTPALPATILALVVLRVAVLATYALMSFSLMSEIRRPAAWDPVAARDLLGFGGWLTVSNIVNPFLDYFDRFFVSALISVAAVTYYATPYEAVTKTLLVPNAVAAVLFPAFSAAYATNRERLTRLFRTGVRVVFLAQLPIALIVITFAPQILRLWLGPAFEARSTGVLRWLMFGILINSLTYLPHSLLQGLKRADLTAKAYMIELPLYLALLVVLIRRLGIDGAAIAWTTRVAVDFLILSWLAARSAGLSMTRLFFMPGVTPVRAPDPD